MSKILRVKRIWWFVIGILLLLVSVFISGIIHGRFNFKYETVEINYPSLPPALDGFTIVHISDLHLKSFNKHHDKLMLVIDSINSYEPDIIVNTGDFVTFLWTEMKTYIDILGSMTAQYGVFAIPGNHDTGIYSEEFSRSNFQEHLDLIGELLSKAKHVYLQNTSYIIRIDTINLSLTGVATYGSTPNLSYGNIDSAMSSNDDVDFSILLTHDPNHWINEIKHRNDINLTLSGHTHGMQIGIILLGLKVSPASLLYPAWNGLYGRENNYLYVNRGLGTIGIPARIGMPPEITIIKLKG